MSNFLQAAMKLCDLGYRIFPCHPGKKTPMTTHGCKDATSDPDQVAEWWTKTPDANIAVSTDGLYVIDVDPLSDGVKNNFADDINRLSDLLEAGCGSSTPRGGQHFWFRQIEGQDLGNTASKISVGVDTRGNGGYVLVPPSETDNGKYNWLQGYELDVSPDGLPPIPLWILDLLEHGPKTDIKFADDGSSKICEGGRNHTLASLAGYLRRSGLSQRAIEAALRSTNLERCVPPLEDSEVSKIAWSVSRYESDQITIAVAEGWHGADKKAAVKAENPGGLPAELLTPGGFLERVLDWSVSTAFRPQPELSLAASLCLLSTITGRKIADTTGLRTNIYTMALCGSGGGKEHTRKVNKDILRLAGGEQFIGPEGIGSHSGVLSHLKVNPVQLFQIDEFGRFMATVNNPGKSPHLFNVIGVLLKLFTSSDSIYIGDAVSDVKRVPRIDQPHAVLYATSVPNSFFESLQKEALSDGFVSRLLVFNSEDDPESQETARENPPDEIIEECRWWLGYRPGGNLSGENPQPRVMNWTPEARSILKDLEIVSRAESKSGRDTASLWTRSAEKARKLAILHAVSLDFSAQQVGAASANWACHLSHYLTARMEWLAKDWVSDGAYEAMLKRILRIISASGTDGISMTSLFRKIQHIPPRQRNDMIASLEQSGQIESTREVSGGRPKLVYRIT